MVRALGWSPKGAVIRRTASAMAFGLATSVLALVPAAPVRAAPVPATRSGKLSPRLQTLATSDGFASPRAKASALSLPSSGVGSLVTRPGGRVLVYVRTSDTSSAGVADLRQRGAQIVDVSPEYSTVTAAVAPSEMEAVAADPAVQYVMEVLAPAVGRVDVPPAGAAADARAQTCQPYVAEGNSAMNVGAARAANHVDGSGETIGILSDSFDTASLPFPDHAAHDVAYGELPGPGNPCGHPTPVEVLSDFDNSAATDEGRAMAQAAHDLAPGASLAFATSEGGELAFANQITALRTQAHASVLVDDVVYPNEPFFQDGPVANAARAATVAGVPYFSSAGNANVIVGGNNVGSYEAPAYRAGACPTFTNLGYSVLDCHDFDPGAGVDTGDGITVAPRGGFDLDLQWAEPRGAVATDYDLFVVNSAGKILAASAIDNASAQQPIESLSWGNTTTSAQTVRIVVAHYSGGATPRLKLVFLASGGITGVEHNVSTGGDLVGPGIVGHTGTSEVGSVAAIPYDNAQTSEYFSSRGPVTHYFDPVPGTNALGSPEVMDKPDFAATDGVQNSFFGQLVGQYWRFYGTSAAAPQAAAIGALLRSKNPLLTPAQVNTALHDTARAVTTNGTADAVGGGYIDANAALATVTALAGKPRAVHGTPGSGQITVSWTPPASNGGIPITGYTITPSLGGVAQTPQTFNSPATSADITALADGDSYTFTVAAVDADGTGPESDPSPTVIVGTPTKPTAVAVTAGGDARVTLAWHTPATDNGDAITGYTITPSIAGVDQTPVVTGVQNSALLTGLTNGASYTFRITATNSRGSGEPSDSTAAFVVGLARAPSRVAARTGNGTATVAFKAPAHNGTHITGYNIAAYRGSTFSSSHNYSAALEHVVHGLANGHSYKFRVRAITSGGPGPPSAFSAPVVIGVPNAPTRVSAAAGPKSATVRWAKPATNGSPITAYRVTVYAGSSARRTIVFHRTATRETVTGLARHHSFTFVVVAVNKRGPGRPSAHSKPVHIR